MKFEVKDTDLEHIFECGQCFRWDMNEDGSYSGIAGSRPARIELEDGHTLTVTTPAEEAGGSAPDGEREFWYRYFDLDLDYGKIKEELIRRDGSGVMEKAVSYGSGIRILRQEPWEMTVSFIISQNNNIPRIKKNIRGLSHAFGEPAEGLGGETVYSLPSSSVLASLTEDDLAPIRLGYRARYLIETAKCVEERGMDVIYEDPGCLCGVGPKVESCIRLFGLHQLESFPIDVWVKRVMSELYGLDRVSEMTDFAERTFGEWGGIAQQYLFYYMRENSRKGEKNRE